MLLERRLPTSLILPISRPFPHRGLMEDLALSSEPTPNPLTSAVTLGNPRGHQDQLHLCLPLTSSTTEVYPDSITQPCSQILLCHHVILLHLQNPLHPYPCFPPSVWTSRPTPRVPSLHQLCPLSMLAPNRQGFLCRLPP